MQDLTTHSSSDARCGPTAAITPASPPGYELIDEIGHGGMGVVYRARDVALDRNVAVKLLSAPYPPDRQFLNSRHRRVCQDRVAGRPPNI